MINAKLTAAALLASSVLAGGYAIAQETTQPAGPAAGAPSTGATLTILEVIEKVAAQGYTDVSEVEREGDTLFEVKARGADGRKMELDVDARTGELLKSERD